MQKKWQSELADQLEGGVSEDRALLDIERGIILNLKHEAIGLWASHGPKNTTGPLTFKHTGIVAFDRIKNLYWKDYDPIAKGEAIIEPHIGSVDTIQVPIRRKWYYSTQMNDTDLARMKQDPIYRASIINDATTALATSLDCELFDLLIATAAGRKDAMIEMQIPKKYLPQEIDIYFNFADIATSIEKIVNKYYRGINRSEIVMIVDPYLYTRIVRALAGAQMLFEKTLSFIQNEAIVAAKISGINIIRHPFLDNYVDNKVSYEKGNYNFRGIRAIIYHVAAPWIVQAFEDTKGVIDKDTGNYRIIKRLITDRGLIYGDLVRVIKDPSTPANPFPFEQNLVEKADNYNDNHGFKDWEIHIPDSVIKLQQNYRKWDLEVGMPEPDTPEHDDSPEGWQQFTYHDVVATWNSERDYLEINGVKLYHAGEDWANDQNGIAGYKNWHDFNLDFSDQKDRPLRFKQFLIWRTSSWTSYWCVPVAWETIAKVKKIKPKSKLIDV